MSQSTIVKAAVLGSLMMAVTTASAASVDDIKQAISTVSSYQMNMTLPDGKTQTSYTKLENGKPSMMKMEMPDGGWSLVKMDAKEMYFKQPGEQAVMKMAAPPQAANQDPAQNLGSDATVTEGDLDGKAVWITEQKTDPKTTLKTWIDKSNGLPLQSETNGQLTKYSYDKVNAVPETTFALPEGMPVTDMSELLDPKNLPQMEK